MAYPPTVPPTGRTNATAQADNHPSDHNAISAALTDIINELGADPSSASFATVQARLDAANRSVPSVVLGSGQTDAGNASLADWLATSVTAPTWAAFALIRTSVTGIFETTGANLPFAMSTRLGGQSGVPANTNGKGVNIRFTESWTDYLNVPTKGSLGIAVMAARPSGGAVRFDTACRAFFDIVWLAS